MVADMLWPAIALVVWTYAVWFWMYVKRFALMRARPPSENDFATMEAARRYFAPVEMPAANLINLFEMPVLFFALLPLLLFTGLGTPAQIWLAWVYVALRVAHSIAQIVIQHVPMRFAIYVLSSAVLLAMWIGFATDLIRFRP